MMRLLAIACSLMVAHVNCAEMKYRFYTQDEGFKDVKVIVNDIWRANSLPQRPLSDRHFHAKIEKLSIRDRDLYHIFAFFHLVQGEGIDGYLVSIMGQYFQACQDAVTRIGSIELLESLTRIQDYLPDEGLPIDPEQRKNAVMKDEQLLDKLTAEPIVFPETLWNHMLIYHKKSG